MLFKDLIDFNCNDNDYIALSIDFTSGRHLDLFTTCFNEGLKIYFDFHINYIGVCMHNIGNDFFKPSLLVFLEE